MVKKMTPIERAKALMMLGMGVSIREVARKMGRSKGAIHTFKKKAKVTKLPLPASSHLGRPAGRKLSEHSVLLLSPVYMLRSGHVISHSLRIYNRFHMPP